MNMFCKILIKLSESYIYNLLGLFRVAIVSVGMCNTSLYSTVWNIYVVPICIYIRTPRFFTTVTYGYNKLQILMVHYAPHFWIIYITYFIL